jgi:hypothetical protein
MKRQVGSLCTLALILSSLSDSWAQGDQRSQPMDPTAQAPATPAPATPPTFPTSVAKPTKDQSEVRVYLGTIVKAGDAYVLKAANEQYRLESQKKAKEYSGKGVKIMGTFDKAKKLIHIQEIEVSPSM